MQVTTTVTGLAPKLAFSEIMSFAFETFCANKVRFLLTGLGMVIGTASLILVVTIGMTGKQFILSEIQKIGTNEIALEYAGGGTSGSENVIYNDYLTRDDEKAVNAQLPGVAYSSPVVEMHDRNQQWMGVADIMKAEAHEEANAVLDKYATRANGIAGTPAPPRQQRCHSRR